MSPLLEGPEKVASRVSGEVCDRSSAVETGGKEPGARQMAALIERANKEGVKIIFVQPQFSRKSAETLAKAIGGAVVSIDPLAADFIENLRDMARQLAAGLNPGIK